MSIFSGKTLVIAFEGWNDASDAASSAAKIICERIEGDPVATVDPEDYYDFQFSRPSVAFDGEANRYVEWPTTDLFAPSREVADANSDLARIHVLLGVEPSLRWQSFASEVLEMIEDREIDAVLFLGSMLADVPHTRPIAVSASSYSEIARQEFEIERSQYEGPIGILTVLSIMLERAGIPGVSLWASVPHYVHNAPSPKATLALLAEAERMLGIQFDHGNLANEAFAWERGIDEVAETDEEMAGYIAQLEKNRDEAESPEASGDAIAWEFEKYLRGDDGNKGENKNEGKEG